jgi:CheY-like chemotaxis protein
MAHILVVEDVKFISRILAEIFQAEGHDVAIAPDGLDALARARAQNPDLILTDIAMPGMDGLTLAKTLKSDKATRHIPIMMVSSRNDRETMVKAHEVGVDEYVVKPFERKQLLEKAAALLGGFRMNLAIEVKEGIPVVTVLHQELEGEIVEQLKQALETARGGGGRPMVLDLTRVLKVAPEASGAILGFDTILREAGGCLEVVPPSRGVGVRYLIAAMEGRIRVHDRKSAAVHSALKVCERPSAGEESAAERVGSGSIAVEHRGKALVIRIRDSSLTAGVMRAVLSEASRGSLDVRLDLQGVTQIAGGEISELVTLATSLTASQRTLRILNPEPEIAEALAARGLAGALLSAKEAPAAG